MGETRPIHNIAGGIDAMSGGPQAVVDDDAVLIVFDAGCLEVQS